MTDRETPLSERLAESVLGITAGQIPLQGHEGFALAAQALVAQADHHVDLFTPDMDPTIYDTEPFIDALRAFAARRPRNRVRVLAQSTERARVEGHGLVRVLRRLPSRVDIRRPPEDYMGRAEEFLVIDGTGCLYRGKATEYLGYVDFHGQWHTQRLMTFFEEVWERSDREPEFLELRI